MRESEFLNYMAAKGLAETTRSQRTYALKRIERAHGVDLDAEFARDALTSLASLFDYSNADAKTGKANPSKLDIEPENLVAHLRWYRSHLRDYRKFKESEAGGEVFDDLEDGEPEDSAIEELVGRTFGLEKDLQSALRANLGQLEPGLVVADGGSEYKVDAGFIDILAKDSAGTWVVVELKAEVARPSACAQILAYMGCIKEEKGGAVRGILVAASHDPRLVFASKAVPNLMLRQYQYRFEFK